MDDGRRRTESYWWSGGCAAARQARSDATKRRVIAKPSIKSRTHEDPVRAGVPPAATPDRSRRAGPAAQEGAIRVGHAPTRRARHPASPRAVQRMPGVNGARTSWHAGLTRRSTRGAPRLPGPPCPERGFRPALDREFCATHPGRGDGWRKGRGYRGFRDTQWCQQIAWRKFDVGGWGAGPRPSVPPRALFPSAPAPQPPPAPAAATPSASPARLAYPHGPPTRSERADAVATRQLHPYFQASPVGAEQARYPHAVVTSSRLWTPGTQILWQYKSPRGLPYIDPMTVVRDDADGLVAWLPAGTEILQNRRADGRDMRAVKAETFTGERVPFRTTWTGNDVPCASLPRASRGRRGSSGTARPTSSAAGTETSRLSIAGRGTWSLPAITPSTS